MKPVTMETATMISSWRRGVMGLRRLAGAPLAHERQPALLPFRQAECVVIYFRISPRNRLRACGGSAATFHTIAIEKHRGVLGLQDARKNCFIDDIGVNQL